VLHCPTAVGGHPPMLVRAERELGLESRLVVFEPQPVDYPVDEVLFTPGSGRVRREAQRWGLLRRALREFDVVHFNFGSSILPRRYPTSVTGNAGVGRSLYGVYAGLVQLRDLPLLKRAGKAIVVTYQGDDARQGDVLQGLGYRFPPELLDSYYPPELDRHKRVAIAAFDRHADAIFALNPDLLHMLPARAEFLPYASVDPAEWRPVSAPEHSGPRVVVHAPSDRRAKGTRFLLEAVERLRRDGFELELQLVEEMDHRAARRQYERADLVVDQLVAGWYGSVAVESMALGKPVLAYVRDADLGGIPEAMRAELPVIVATTETIADVLAEWVTTRRSELPAVGQRGRAFVERWHDPRRIAARTKHVYERSVRQRGDRSRSRAAAGTRP